MVDSTELKTTVEESEEVIAEALGVKLVDCQTGAYRVDYTEQGRAYHSIHFDYPSAEVRFMQCVCGGEY